MTGTAAVAFIVMGLHVPSLTAEAAVPDCPGFVYELPWTGTDALAYVVRHETFDGEWLVPVILYMESNGIHGLQREDSLCDSTPAGYRPDALLLDGVQAP